MKLKILTLVIAMTGLFWVSAYAASPQPVAIVVGGRTLELPQAPYNDRGTVMVPLRGLFEQLGIQVLWDQHTRTVTAISQTKRIVLEIDRTTAFVDGEETVLSVPPVIRNHTTFVPLRFLVTHSGFPVHWDQERQTVRIGVPALTSPENRQSAGSNADSSVAAHESDAEMNPAVAEHEAMANRPPAATGRVLDSAGTPVSGATVNVNYVGDGNKDYSATTVQDGTFSIAELQSGATYVAYAHPPDRRHPDNHSEPYAFRYEGKPLELPVLSLRAVQLQGKVNVNPDELRGGYIHLLLYEVEKSGEWKNISSHFLYEQKDFKWSGLSAGKQYVVQAHYFDGNGKESTALNIDSGNQRFVYRSDLPANWEITVSKPPPKPYIRLIAPEGQSLDTRNLSIGVMDASGKSYAVMYTKDGHFEILGLQPGASITVSVNLSGERVYAKPEPMTATYEPGRLLLGEIRLQPQKSAQLSGLVLDDWGKTIENFYIDMVDTNTGRQWTDSWNQAKGKFLVYDLEPGHKYRLEIGANDEMKTTYDSYVSLPAYEFVYDASMTELPAFVIPKVQVIGRVVQPDGSPLSTYSKLYDENGSLLSHFPGKLDRQFAAGGMVEGQRYTVQLFLYRVRTSDDVPIGAARLHSFSFVYHGSLKRFDDIVFDMDAKMPGESRYVRGKVVDTEGKPVANVRVQTEQMQDGRLVAVMVSTNSNGEYQFVFHYPVQGEIYAYGNDGQSSAVTFSVNDQDITVQDAIYTRYDVND